MNKKRLDLSVGQVIRSLKPGTSEEFDVWRINGLYYGSGTGDSIVGLTSLSSKEHDEDEYLMPMMLVEAAIKGGVAEFI